MSSPPPDVPRLEYDKVVLELAEQHGTDVVEVLKDTYSPLAFPMYESSIRNLGVEGLMKEDESGWHLTVDGRNYLHNVRFRRHLKKQLWVAVGAVVASALFQALALFCS